MAHNPFTSTAAVCQRTTRKGYVSTEENYRITAEASTHSGGEGRGGEGGGGHTISHTFLAKQPAPSNEETYTTVCSKYGEKDAGILAVDWITH